jgi:NADH-quinone oxidoreductase subunit A
MAAITETGARRDTRIVPEDRSANIGLPRMLHCAKPPPASHLGTGPGSLERGGYRSRLAGTGRERRAGHRSARKRVKMNALLQEYLPLVIFIGVSMVIGLALLVAPFIVAYRQPDPEKLSAYECGFDAFDDARMKFDVRFYLVAILFIIFDLEVTFLFPWAVAFGKIGTLGFWSMMVFLGVLTIGFIYEWKKGALEWD